MRALGVFTLVACLAAASAQAASGAGSAPVASATSNAAKISKVAKLRAPWPARRGRRTGEEEGEPGVPGCGEEDDCDEHMTKWSIVVGVMALAGTFIIGFLLESAHVHWMPEAAVGVLMGLIVATLFKNFGGPQATDLLLHETFDFEFFMTWLLPPIIFEAGFNMNKTAFFANIGPTMFYAFIGTFASTFVVGGIVYWAGLQGWCHLMDPIAALTFGALISATDPVTVLAVFQASAAPLLRLSSCSLPACRRAMPTRCSSAAGDRRA